MRHGDLFIPSLNPNQQKDPNMNKTDKTVINLATPIRSERVRGFQPPWRTVYVYRCANGHEMRIRANSFIGRNPTPGIGGVYCNQCKP